MAIARDQQGFRIRTDNTAAQGGTPVWAAAQNTNVTLPSGIASPFRIRFAMANTGSTSPGTAIYELYASFNGGAYAQVVTVAGTSPIVSIDATAGASANNSAITSSLLTGVSGTFLNGQYMSGNQSTTFIMTTGNYTELEFGLYIQPRYTKNGDTIAFRLYANNAAIESYTQTPTITVSQGATQVQVTQALLEEWQSQDFVPPQERVTQVLLEEWQSQDFVPPQERVTQVILEEWASVTTVSTQAVATQVLLEEWTRVIVVAAPPSGRIRIMA